MCLRGSCRRFDTFPIFETQRLLIPITPKIINIMDSFETELEQKLNKLSETRSHKKIKFKAPIEPPSHFKNELDQFSHIINTQGEVQRHDEMGSRLRSEKNSDRKETVRDQNRVAKQKESRVEIKPQIEVKRQNEAVQLIENKQLSEFLSRNFGPNCESIDISFFLAKCLAQFSRDSDLPEEQIKLIFLKLQQQITTTDPNRVSLNALELAVRRNYGSFPLYIGNKITWSEQEVRNSKLKNKQKQIERISQATQRQLQNRQKQVEELQKSLKERQKEITKKQKAFQVKEKQFMERMKAHKKLLEQKSQKLAQQHMNALSIAFQKIEKKINSYERNMKYRVESLNQKINEMHNIRDQKVTDLRGSILKQIEDKYDKAYGNKIRKYEMEVKDLGQKLQLAKKQVKEYEEQNNKLAKIAVKLESKLTKEEVKLKELQQSLNAKKEQFRELQLFCTEKEKENQKLIKKMMASKEGSNQKEKDPRVKRSQSKKALSNKKSSPSDELERVESGEIIEVYEEVLKIFIQKQGSILNKLTLERILSLSIGLGMSNSGYFCQNLFQFAFQAIIKVICQCMDLKSKYKELREMLGQFSEAHLTIPDSFSDSKKNKKKSKRKQEQNHLKYIWKLSVTLYILSKPDDKTQLERIYEYSQDSQIYNQMAESLGNTEFNFVYALIIKYIGEAKEIDLNVFCVFADLALEFNIIGQQQHDRFWKCVGQDIVNAFAFSAKNCLKNQKYFEGVYDSIEKISILIQRLVVFHQITVQSHMESTFEGLAKKCKGTLLQKNLKSMIESSTYRNYEGQSILGQLQK